MKVEARGKYGGVKVHLDPEEAKLFLEVFTVQEHPEANEVMDKMGHIDTLSIKIGKKIGALLKQVPDLLRDKSDEKVKEVLMAEQKKAADKLAALEKGGDWKGIH